MAKLRLKNGKEVEISVRENDDGSVTMRVIGVAAGAILKIKPSGYLYREPSVDESIGLKLNDQYKIKLAKNAW